MKMITLILVLMLMPLVLADVSYEPYVRITSSSESASSINLSAINVNNSLYWQGHTGTDGSWLTGISTYNSTYDLWAYNQTTAVNTLWGKWFYNMSDGKMDYTNIAMLNQSNNFGKNNITINNSLVLQRNNLLNSTYDFAGAYVNNSYTSLYFDASAPFGETFADFTVQASATEYGTASYTDGSPSGASSGWALIKFTVVPAVSQISSIVVTATVACNSLSGTVGNISIWNFTSTGWIQFGTTSNTIATYTTTINDVSNFVNGSGNLFIMCKGTTGNPNAKQAKIDYVKLDVIADTEINNMNWNNDLISVGWKPAILSGTFGTSTSPISQAFVRGLVVTDEGVATDPDKIINVRKSIATGNPVLMFMNVSLNAPTTSYLMDFEGYANPTSKGGAFLYNVKSNYSAGISRYYTYFVGNIGDAVPEPKTTGHRNFSNEWEIRGYYANIYLNTSSTLTAMSGMELNVEQGQSVGGAVGVKATIQGAGKNWAFYSIKGDWALADDNQKLSFGLGTNPTDFRNYVPDAEIYYDGTNMIFNTNKTGSGIAWFSSNVSADNIIDRSDYWDIATRGSALSSVKSYEQMSVGGVPSDSKLSQYEKATYKVSDTSNCWNVYNYVPYYCLITNEKECVNTIDIKDAKLYKQFNQTITSKECGSKDEVGRSVSTVLGKHEQALAELKQCILNSNTLEEVKSCVAK